MWDAFQREVLTALGHVVLVPAAPVDTRPGPVPAAPDTSHPALLGALLRATGVGVERLGELPPLDQLRSPAAKRALWPRLRAMRSAARS